MLKIFQTPLNINHNCVPKVVKYRGVRNQFTIISVFELKLLLCKSIRGLFDMLCVLYIAQRNYYALHDFVDDDTLENVTGRYYPIPKCYTKKISRNITGIINDGLCLDLGTFVYCMIMLHHIYLSLLNNFLSRRMLPSCHAHHTFQI